MEGGMGEKYITGCLAGDGIKAVCDVQEQKGS